MVCKTLIPSSNLGVASTRERVGIPTLSFFYLIMYIYSRVIMRKETEDEKMMVMTGRGIRPAESENRPFKVGLHRRVISLFAVRGCFGDAYSWLLHE